MVTWRGVFLADGSIERMRGGNVDNLIAGAGCACVLHGLDLRFDGHDDHRCGWRFSLL
jgi:hypothetical protein